MNSASFHGRSVPRAVLSRRLVCLEELLATAPVGLGLLNTECQYLWVNPILAKVNGRTMEDHVGRTMQEIRPDIGETLGPLLRGLLATGGPVPDFMIGRIGPDPYGSPLQWRGRLRLLRASDHVVLGIGVVIEPQLSEWNERTPAAPSPTEELDRQRYGLIETLVHELKNPLTPILSAAQMLQRYGTKKPDVVAWAGVSIERQARQLNAAVNDYLELARAALGKLDLRQSKLDLKPVLERAIEACPEPQRGCPSLNLKLPSCELWVLGDTVRLGKVLHHLLLNAVQFTPPEGHVTLAAAIEDDHVVIRVSDTGDGVDPEALERIFEPFFQMDDAQFRKTRSMGVGLALARRLITLHGGTLHAVSRGRGSGTEFVARLPAVVPPTGGAAGRSDRNAQEPDPEARMKSPSGDSGSPL